MHKHTLVTRFLSMVLVVAMLLSCLPGVIFTVSASNDADATEPAFAADNSEASITETASTSTVSTYTASLHSAGANARGGSSESDVNKPESGGYVDQNTTLDPSTVPDNREVFYNAVGVTMQVVYFPYGESYNRTNSYDHVIDTLKNYTYTDENGDEVITVYDGLTITDNTFIGDPATGRIYKAEGINKDQSSGLYKTFELVTGRHDDFGGTIHPGFHDCVSGPAAVSTENGITTYTMPEPTDIELFLKHIIFGSDYGAWDKTSVAKDANGENTEKLEEDVSLYTKLLKYLGCKENYIENYLLSYNGYLSVTDDADVMIPTIIWSYVMADCAYAWDDDGTVQYGHGYTGDNSAEGIVEYNYVDPYAVACCDGSDFSGEGNHHGAVTNITVQGKPNRKLITSVQTVGDIVYRSYKNNIEPNGSVRYLYDEAAAEAYWNHWWRGEILTAATTGNNRYPLYKDNNGTLNTIATTNGYSNADKCDYWYRIYHNQGRNTNYCSWYYYCSYSCIDLLGAHGVHTSTIKQRHYYGRHGVGSGFVNSINADGVDESNGNKYYFRGYWTPFGEKITGTLELTKNVSSEDTAAATDLSGWRFELYETEADAIAGTGYLRGEYTDSTGSVLFEGLRYGDTFYIKEAPLERQDQRSSLSGWSTSDQIFSGKVPEDSVLTVGTATNTYVPGTPISIQKSPSCSSAVYAQIENNPLYSLAGAEYTIYLNGVAQEVLITDAGGNATSSTNYDIGAKLTIQETKAPAGFKLNEEVYEWTVVDGTNTVAVEDEPVFDPGTLSFQKTNSSTNAAMGNTSYEGAIFKWEYYANSNWSGTPVRIWYFKTNTRGYYGYRDTFLLDNVSYPSDELYLNTTSDTSLPLGSIKITEVVAPAGYTTMEVLYATVTQPSSGGSAAFDWTDNSWEYITTDAAGTFIGEEPIDVDTFGSVSVQKLDTDTGAELQGEVENLKTKFQVINRSTNSVKIGGFDVAAPGEVCYEFWTAEDGSYTSGNIFPIGSYELIEAIPPTGMTLNETWFRTFTVTADTRAFDFTSDEDALKNDIIRGGVLISKEDAALGSSTNENVMLEGISFYVSTMNENPIVIDGVPYDMGETVATMELEWNETLGKWTASLPGNTLPYGTYQVGENPQKYGSEHANDYYYVTDTVYTFSIRTDGEIVTLDTSGNAMEFENEVRPGKIVIEKVNFYRQHLAGAEFLLEWSEDGSTWAPVTFHDGQYPVKGGCTTASIADGKLVTDNTGIITFDGLHPGLLYRVTETKAPDSYVLLADYAFSGELPADDLMVSLKIYNSQGYLLPSTGENDFIFMIAGGTILTLFTIFSFVMLAVRSTREPTVCYSENAEQNKIFMKRRSHK